LQFLKYFLSLARVPLSRKVDIAKYIAIQYFIAHKGPTGPLGSAKGLATI
jgi:hypothetical protein